MPGKCALWIITIITTKYINKQLLNVFWLFPSLHLRNVWSRNQSYSFRIQSATDKLSADKNTALIIYTFIRRKILRFRCAETSRKIQKQQMLLKQKGFQPRFEYVNIWRSSDLERQGIPSSWSCHRKCPSTIGCCFYARSRL